MESTSRILVVEDDPTLQRVVSLFAGKLGYTAVVVGSGIEALSAVGEQPGFDLVFMDLRLPDIDGIECARAIREMKDLQGLPIVALTAHTQTEDKQLSLEAGMNDFMCKPYTLKQFQTMVEKWIKVQPGK